jgi:hypothetical protein
LASTAFNGVDFEEGTELTGLAGAGAGTEGLGTVVFGGTDGAGPDGALFKVERKPVVWLAAGAAAGLLVAGRCPAEVEPTALIWLADTARALALLYICALKAANFFISCKTSSSTSPLTSSFSTYQTPFEVCCKANLYLGLIVWASILHRLSLAFKT